MRRNIALVLALVMILSLIPMSAAAQTGSATFTRLTSIQSVARNTYVGADVRIEVKVPANAVANTGTDDFYLTIPRGVEVRGGITIEPPTGGGWTTPFYTQGTAVGSANTTTDVQFRYTAAANTEGKTVIRFEDVFVTSSFSGDELSFAVDSAPGSVFGSTGLVFASIASGDVTVSIIDVDFITDGTQSNTISNIRISENQAGALNTTMKLKLPRGFYWDITTTTLPASATRWGDTTKTLTYSPTDQIGSTGNYQSVLFTVSDRTSSATSWEVSGLAIKVDPTLAQMGEVVADVTDANPSTLAVAIYGDYLAEVTGVTNPQRLAGKEKQGLGRFQIEEKVGGTLIPGRTVTMTLPSGAKWNVNENGILDAIPGVRAADSVNSSNFSTMGWQVVDVAGRTIRGTIGGTIATAVNNPAKVVFNSGHFVTEPGFEGDVTVLFGGSAGIGGEIVLAEVVKPVVAEAAELTDVRLGVQNQVVGDIVITESMTGALERDGVIVLRPVWEGVRFANTPTAVADGDIIIEDIWVAPNRQTVSIRINADSDKEVSSITLSNLALSLDRVLPEGMLELEVSGDAVIDDVIWSDITRNSTTQSAYFRGASVSSTFAVANVVTPADDAVAPGAGATVGFTVGSTTYTVDGEMKMMDVAPFISNDRLMIPVRYLEEMFGVQPVWNAGARTVTVLYDGKVFEMAIGSNVLRVNGAPYMEMDAEAQIVNDRTFVPASRFARAMGVGYSWDAATQTATFN